MALPNDEALGDLDEVETDAEAKEEPAPVDLADVELED